MHTPEGILDRLRSGDNTAVFDFLRLYAGYIYDFPKIRHRQRIIDSGEFYEYVASKLSGGNRLLQYDAEKGKFDVWFTKVLDNFLNTLTTAKLRERAQSPICLPDLDEIQSAEPTVAELLEFEDEKRALSEIFQELNDNEKAVAILHTVFYKDLEPEELEFLSRFTQKTVDGLAAELELFLTGELQDENERITRESKKIAGLHRSLQSLHATLEEAKLQLQVELESGTPNQERVSKLRALIQKSEFIEWKKTTKYHQLSQVHRRGKGLVILKNRKIAEFLGHSLGTVTSTVTRMRRKYKKLLLQHRLQ